MPPGVIQFIPGSGAQVGPTVMRSSALAGVAFLQEAPQCFRECGKTVGENIANYKTYPRIVGETGGKDFIFAHCLGFLFRS